MSGEKELKKWFEEMNKIRKEFNAGCFATTLEFDTYNIYVIATDKETKPTDCLNEDEEYE